MSEEIDTTNRQLVGMDGTGTITIVMTTHCMTRDQALSHAAWLAVIADPLGDDFERVLSAVRGT